MKFRKKPVVVEARQATGTPESNSDIVEWTRGSATPAQTYEHPVRGESLCLPTLEGVMWVDQNDWIIRGVAGEFYPIKDGIFRQTYEAVE